MTQAPKIIRETARGIIIRGDKILLFRRTRKNDQGGIDVWLSIPGGALETFETPEHAVKREIYEELGLDVLTTSLLAIQDVPVDESRHFYFLCTTSNGEPVLQEQSEEYRRMQDEANTYVIKWMSLNDPILIDELYWAYADAYKKIVPLLKAESDEPLVMVTDKRS